MSSKRIKTVCCDNMPFVEEAFSTLGDTVLKDGRQISAADVRDADLLATRSTTKVNAELLEGSSIKFVGTATIGTDHIDQDYLEKQGITWMFAAGCNANSVSEYVTSALLSLARKHGFSLKGKKMGIVGVGNVGSRVAKKARILGMTTLLNDPPRERDQAEGFDASDDDFLPLDAVLAESDIITFHVPITKDGQDPTWHMADSSLFKKLKPNCIFINASRGPVVDSEALKATISTKAIAHTVMDTWEGEPGIEQELLDMVDIATPHIAGHSYEGKVMGTVMVYREACRFLDVGAEWDYESLLPAPVVPEVSVDCAGRDEEDVLNEIVSAVYDVQDDDRDIRAKNSDMAKHFDSLRKDYRIRREFRFTKVIAANATPSLLKTIKALGFNV